MNNGLDRSAQTLSIGLLQATDPITSLSLESGVVSTADFLEAKPRLGSLISLDIKAGTLLVLEPEFLSGHSTLQRLTIYGDIEIRAGALQGMTALRQLDVRDVKSFPGSVLSGCTALETANLAAVESVQAGTFAGLTSLTDVTVTAARFLYANAFAGCTSIEGIHLPSVLEFFGDGHFSGCTKLESLFLLHLTFVDPDSVNIFADCPLFATLTLWTIPPDRFHADIFTNRHSNLPMSVVLPDINSWRNYVAQSTVVDGHLFWYGVPHPKNEPEQPPIDSSESESDEIPSQSPEETATTSAEVTATQSPEKTPDKSPVQSPLESPKQSEREIPTKTPVSEPKENNNLVLVVMTVIGFVLFGLTAAVAGRLWCKLRQSSKRREKCYA
jgi:hypothetical protein